MLGVEATGGERDVFNLSVGETATYFVGEPRALVHNTSPSGLCDTANQRPTFDELMERAGNDLDFSTAEDGAVFWSGPNMRTAQQWARENGKTTLEQTNGGRYLDDLNLFGENSGMTGGEAAQIWDRASARFAEGASGEVNVFPTGARRYGPFGERTWWRIEKPILEGNQNVRQITRRRRDGNRIGDPR